MKSPFGILDLGLMAEWLGVSNAIYVMAVDGMLMIVVLTVWSALLRRSLQAASRAAAGVTEK